MPRLRNAIAAFSLTFVAATLSAFAQNGVPDIDKLSEQNGITDVYLSSYMLKNSQLSLGQSDGHGPSMQALMQDIESIRIFTASEKSDIALMKEVFAPISKSAAKGYERLFSLKREENIMNLIGRVKGDKVEGLYLLIDSSDEMVAIIFGGTFTRKQVEQMMSEASDAKRSDEKKKRR